MSATVVPHARAPESGEPLPLEDLVAPYLSQGIVAVTGPRGAGKSTACRHLAACFPVARFVDDPDADTFERGGPFTYFARERRPVDHVAHLPLAPWTTDQVVEYLLLEHRDACGSVMARLRRAPDADLPNGVAEMWTAALDAMARDESIPDVATALRAIYAPDLNRAGSIALSCTPKGYLPADAWTRLHDSGWGTRARRLIRHRPVQAALAAAAIAERLGRGGKLGGLRRGFPRDVPPLAGPPIMADVGVRVALENLLDMPDRQAAAASLLHAAGVPFRPRPRAQLEDACLRGVRWPGVDLNAAVLRRADLAGAELTGANLDAASAAGVRLERARMHGASLRRFYAPGARLARADLTFVRAEGADFGDADLSRADLRGALLAGARLSRADLAGARLARANLTGARLGGACVDGADFGGACLDRAMLKRLDLRDARLARASLAGADLCHVRLAGVRIPGAVLDRAQLRDADLTGAHMPDGHLKGADLRQARAADVCWERADLRAADLRKVNFHMGSSRSGRVDSFLASEGTRTGFYADDYEEMHFKAPEEIRKANLRGADLRGAEVAGTDFYLVDLREARYTAAQERHFRRCGAILSVTRRR